MKVVVIGGVGLVGSIVVRMMEADGSYEVANIEALTYSFNLESCADVAQQLTVTRK